MKRAPTVNRTNMPAGWTPPHPAWQAVWNDTRDPLVAGYFGVQAAQPALLEQWARPALVESDAPLAVEQGVFRDRRGTCNFLYIGYWRRSAYRDWWAHDGNCGWWQDRRRLRDGVGYWREIVTMPFERFETLHLTESAHGISVSADGLHGPIAEHAYPGAMRDRIPLSATCSLRNPDGLDTPLHTEVFDDGKRVVVEPPRNMCVIRSGQNWSLCDVREKAWYLEKVHPVLLEAMRFLSEHPEETNCYALRLVCRTNQAWHNVEQSFGLGYATDVHAFEHWAKRHPTHLAIFDRFLEMVEEFREAMQLRLWHEVTSVPGPGCEFEYVACHPQTGLLPYA